MSTYMTLEKMDNVVAKIEAIYLVKTILEALLAVN